MKWVRTQFLSLLLSVFISYGTFANETVQLYHEDGKYGYVNADGEVVVEATYLFAAPFNDLGLALVTQDVAQNGWPYENGYIDTTGTVVVPLLYQQLGDFSEGLATAQKEGKWGYISLDGSVVIDFIYDEVSDFNQGKAVVKLNGVASVIERPEWERSTLSLSEADYIMLASADAYLTYLETVFQQRELSEFNQADYVLLERFLEKLMMKMPVLNAKIEGTNVYILNDSYYNVRSVSREAVQHLEELFEEYDMAVSTDMERLLSLMYQGIANVTYEGVPVPTYRDVSYTIATFPVPYFNPNLYKNYTTITEFTTYLRKQLDELQGMSPNTSGAESLVQFLNDMYLTLEPLHLKAWFNQVEIGTEKQKEEFKTVYDVVAQVNSILAEYNILLFESIANPFTILVDGVNHSKPVRFTIHPDYLNSYMNLVEGLHIFVGNQGQGVYLPATELQHLFHVYGTLCFDILYDETNTVQLTLRKEEDKTEYAQYGALIYITVPTETPTATVYATIPNQQLEANWGGIPKDDGTITFGTWYSGEYELKDTEISMGDIQTLSEETQEKIQFMVSKGFFEVEEGYFYPEEPLTRVQLVTTLVKMFFVQDSRATSQFRDVNATTEAYPFVSAAYQAGIVTPYSDNSFRGNTLLTQEELVHFVASTLSQRKGYKTTGSSEETITAFLDYEDISESYISDVALAIEHKLVSAGGYFLPTSVVTRREAVEYLYDLYYNLYDSPVQDASFSVITHGQKVPLLAICLLVTVILIYIIARKIKERLEIANDFKRRVQRMPTRRKKSKSNLNRNLDLDLDNIDLRDYEEY